MSSGAGSAAGRGALAVGRRRAVLSLVVLGLSLPVAWLLSGGLGAVPLSLGEVWGAWTGRGSDLARAIVWQDRLPRSLLAALVGAQLAAAGGLLQGILRNPLASPDLLGVSAGASLAAVLVLITIPGLGVGLLPVAAFAGGLAAALVVYVATGRRNVGADTLALAGVVVSAVVQALASGLMVWHASQSAAAMVWLAGGFWGRDWRHVTTLWPWSLAGLVAAALAARHVNVVALGDEVAEGLGVSVRRARPALALLAVVLTASAVAMAGPIGFVGLLVPHAVRWWLGPDHRVTLLASALVGAHLVLWADVAGRTIWAPVEIPAGIVTAVLGAPYFARLLTRPGLTRPA